MSTRNTVVLTRRSRPEPAASRIAARLARTRSACPAASSATNSPVAGSSPSCPATKTRSPARIAWLYGPAAAGAPVVLICSRVDMALLFGDPLDRCRRRPRSSHPRTDARGREPIDHRGCPLRIVDEAEDRRTGAGELRCPAGPADGSEHVGELRPQSPRRGEEVVGASTPLVRTELREDLGRGEAEWWMDEDDELCPRLDRVDPLADAPDARGRQARREERHVRPDRGQLIEILRGRLVRLAVVRPPQAPGSGRIRRSPAHARRGWNPLLDRQAGGIRRSPVAGDEAPPREVLAADRHAVRLIALDAQPGASGVEEKPVGELEEHEGALEDVVPVLPPTDDGEREVQLRGCLQRQRAHRAGASPVARQAHSSTDRVCGRRSRETPHVSSADSSASGTSGSSRPSPLWIC